MPFHPDAHHRRSIRLQGYDYRLGGAYFVTICTHSRECVLGEATDGEMRLSEAGKIVAGSWAWLAERYPHVSLDASIIMPNHVHGVVVLSEGGPQEGGSRSAPTRKPLGRLIAAFKTVSSKAVNALPEPPGVRLWQRNFFERIIRSREELFRVRAYIASNPARWFEDPENPARQERQGGG